MGYIEISLKMPTDYSDEELREAVKKELEIVKNNIYCKPELDEKLRFEILNKSLDARKKSDIHWVIRVGVDNLSSNSEIENSKHFGHQIFKEKLNIPYRRREEKVIVVGSGPAGFFAAYLLQKAGFNTTIIERGSKVTKREALIKEFESTGKFNSITNYAFGEGGAGTFSDGKLTSRSKNISKEKEFILSSYVQAGAPEEILYMAHSHLGSDNLKQIIKNLRNSFISMGGTILFETLVKDFKLNSCSNRDVNSSNNKVVGVFVSSTASDSTTSDSATSDPIASGSIISDNKIKTSNEKFVDEIEADHFIVASGHSAYETYRMLIAKGVEFKTKNFAIGCRVEHRQELINLAQWGKKSLIGVKAAEYRLASRGDGHLPVYTFCMCPGGIIVPSTAYEKANIVNGMSRYKRDGIFANAACVAGVNLNKLLSRDVDAQDALDWLENLENDFYRYSGGYAAPFCSINDFIDKKIRTKPHSIANNVVESSYPLGLKIAPLWELLPKEIIVAITEGLKDFSRKIRGFETGLIMGLESKTSSPISVVREKSCCCTGFNNLYMVGEGSGHAGGIISSGADGIKAALSIIEAYEH
ncbi:MAG: FAD-dependent monooxygenase [Desulfamplus sp.]|nr:FAD-dependent monooxygenase [Desulfamplus sp.]